MTSDRNTTRRRLLVAATASTAALGALAATMWGRRQDVVKIGVGQPLSGELALMGKDMLQGAQLAADEINADGGVNIDGRRMQVQIVPADDKASPEVGIEAARQLVAADVVAAIAHLNSGVSIAAAPIYAAAGIPQLAISTNPRYTQLGLPTTLRLVANDDLQALALGSYAAGLPGAQRFAVVDDATPYGKGLADGVAARIKSGGREVVLRQALDNKTTQFDALLLALAEAKPDVLVSTLADFQLEVLLPQMAARGLAGVAVIGGDNIKTEKLLPLAAKVRALYATSPIAGAHEFRTGKVFLEKYRHRFGTDPYYAGHYAYDAVMLLRHALERNRSLDRTALLARLKTFEGNAPITGTLRMRADGEQRYGAVGVYRLGASGWDLQVRSDRW